MSQVAGHPKVKLPSQNPSSVMNRTNTSRYNRFHSFRVAAEPSSPSPLVNRGSRLDVTIQSEQYQHQATHNKQSSEKVFTPLKSLSHPHQHSPVSVNRRRRHRRLECEGAACRLGSKLDESVRGQLGLPGPAACLRNTAQARRKLGASSAHAFENIREFRPDLELPNMLRMASGETTSWSELVASSARAGRASKTIFLSILKHPDTPPHTQTPPTEPMGDCLNRLNGRPSKTPS